MDPEIVPGRTRGVKMGESSGKYYLHSYENEGLRNSEEQKLQAGLSNFFYFDHILFDLRRKAMGLPGNPVKIKSSGAP